MVLTIPLVPALRDRNKITLAEEIDMKPRNKTPRKGLFSSKGLTLPLITALFPAALIAEEPAHTLDKPFGEVEIGVGYVNQDSFKFGDYTGLEDHGPYFIGNMDLTGRDNESANYWKIQADNLGLRSKSATGA